MGMLERIKKKQIEGFKDFVESLETAPPASRAAIFMSGVLEDPRFMSWVTKNIRSFSGFLEFPTDEIEIVLRSSETMVTVLMKALSPKTEEELQQMSSVFPHFIGRLREENQLLSEVLPSEREAAQLHVLRAIRKLQKLEKIQGFHWELPPLEIFQERLAIKDGMIELTFDDGKIAAVGEILKGKRIGVWKHYYDNGQLMAEGPYLEGIKTGPWTFFYGNGAIRSKGKYQDDARHGLWEEWERDGTMREVEWVEGKRQ